MSQRLGVSAGATPQISGSVSSPADARVSDPVREKFAPMIQGMDALNAAKTLKASGYLNYAREYAQKAVAENPESFEALLLLGQLLPHDGNDRATTFRRLVEMDPTSVGALYGLGQTLYLSDHPEEAIPYLEKVVKMDPSNGSGYHVLGKSYEKMGRYDEALAAYKKAYEINKGSVTLMHIQAIEEGHPRFKPVQRESQGRLLEESPPEETSPEIPPQDEAPSTPDKAEKLPRETESVDKPMMEADESENKDKNVRYQQMLDELQRMIDEGQGVIDKDATPVPKDEHPQRERDADRNKRSHSRQRHDEDESDQK